MEILGFDVAAPADRRYDEDTLSLYKIRYTHHQFKKNKSPRTFNEEVQSYLNALGDFPYLFTQELSSKGITHTHLICYLPGPEYIQSLFNQFIRKNKSAYTCVMYDTPNERTPEYYFGYIYKTYTTDILTNIPQEKLDFYYNTYIRTSTKTTDDMVNWVVTNYPYSTVTAPSGYDQQVLLDTILSFHKHNRKVYDYKIIIKREFHLCRLIMFETIERSYAAAHQRDLLDL